jgi:7-cyano-7-deazaguanine reductase
MHFDSLSLPLGKHTEYTDRYDPRLLVAVPRSQTRDFWPESSTLPFTGEDHWTAYELSWLNNKGKPQVMCALICYHALSPAIVESKSLKLYFNSLNQTVFASHDQVAATISSDLSATVGDLVQVSLYLPDSLTPLTLSPWQDHCIDHLDIEITQYTCDAGLLGCDPDTVIKETLVSHLFRSLCPVTGQPDWASVRIHYCGPRLCHDSLLRYLCAYRQHGGFHEQCIERIFCDIHQRCAPEQLSVEGRFTRRGGLDINPFRSSHANTHTTHARQVRQ